MLEQTPIIICEGRYAANRPDSFGIEACAAPEQFNVLVSQAAKLLIGQFVHAEANAVLAEWLVRSPCHKCAWRRVNESWDLIAQPSFYARKEERN